MIRVEARAHLKLVICCSSTCSGRRRGEACCACCGSAGLATADNGASTADDGAFAEAPVAAAAALSTKTPLAHLGCCHSVLRPTSKSVKRWEGPAAVVVMITCREHQTVGQSAKAVVVVITCAASASRDNRMDTSLAYLQML